ncbi:MAG TPA: hypothetical protein VHY82_09780, partial [Acetobacteraceae bacterium]|nr:hypothetical protein [Acetobacteraceae bacterium]
MLAAVLDLHAEKRGAAQKSWPEARKRIEVLFRPLLQKPTETLIAADFQMLADRHPAGSTASLAVREPAKLLPVLHASGPPDARAMRFMLLTLTRRQEAAGSEDRPL